MSEPPRKKSRFFSAGNILGGLLGRRKSKKGKGNFTNDQNGDDVAEDHGDEVSSSSLSSRAQQSGTGEVQGQSLSALPAFPDAQGQESAEQSTTTRDKGKSRMDLENDEGGVSGQGPRLARRRNKGRFRISAEDDDEGEDADEVEDDNNMRHSVVPSAEKGEQNGESNLAPPQPRALRPMSQAAEALSRLKVRDPRRQGVYGAQDLLSTGSQASTGPAVQPDSTHAEHDQTPSGSGVASGGAAQAHLAAGIATQALNPTTDSTLDNKSQTHQPPVPAQTRPGESNQGQSSNSLPPATTPSNSESLPLPRVHNPGQVQSLHPEDTTAEPESGYKLLTGGRPPPEPPGRPLFDPSNPTERQPFLPRPIRQLIDLDRDPYGKRMTRPSLRPIANLPNRGITNLPLHATETPTHRRPNDGVPENAYMSPTRKLRLQHPELFIARRSRKRKRRLPVLPPPAYIFTRTGDANFNVFNGILLYPELCMALAAQLPLNDLISLYAISKDFHTIIDTRFTTVILNQSLRKAPESSRCFMFRSYLHLCRTDPAARIPHPDPVKAAKGIIRAIPSFRWLKMVLHREKVVHELMTLFAEEGIPMPPRCAYAIKRMWFMLDIPDNARRIGYIHSKHLITDLDLYFAMCFFVKLDMLLNDPVASEKRDQMRKLLLSQESFTTLLRYLKGDIWRTELELLKEFVKWKYVPNEAEDDQNVQSIFGIPRKQWGKLRYEYWGKVEAEKVGKKQLALLLRPEQCVMREAVRRGLRFHRHFLRCLLYGYVRPDTLENYEPREYTRRIPEWKDEEYDVDDVVGGVHALSVEVGRDDLLDLGPTRNVSKYTIVKEAATEQELKLRLQQEYFLNKCMEWYRSELEVMEADQMDWDA